MLKTKIKHLEFDIKPTLNWLKSIAAATYNLDAYNIIAKYDALKIEFEQYEKKSRYEIDDLSTKLSKCKLERTEALENLKKLSNDVMYPLIEQMAVRDKELLVAKTDQSQLRINLKMLHAILRSPKLCDMYAKEERK